MQEIPSLFCRDYDKPYGARLDGTTASCRTPPLSILSRCRCCRCFTASPCTVSWRSWSRCTR